MYVFILNSLTEDKNYFIWELFLKDHVTELMAAESHNRNKLNFKIH